MIIAKVDSTQNLIAAYHAMRVRKALISLVAVQHFVFSVLMELLTATLGRTLSEPALSVQQENMPVQRVHPCVLRVLKVTFSPSVVNLVALSALGIKQVIVVASIVSMIRILHR